jgi:hypothetical protein
MSDKTEELAEPAPADEPTPAAEPTPSDEPELPVAEALSNVSPFVPAGQQTSSRREVPSVFPGIRRFDC